MFKQFGSKAAAGEEAKRNLIFTRPPHRLSEQAFTQAVR